MFENIKNKKNNNDNTKTNVKFFNKSQTNAAINWWYKSNAMFVHMSATVAGRWRNERRREKNTLFA